MDLKQKLTTRNGLWYLLSAVLFVLAGTVDFIPAWNKGFGLCYWRDWERSLSGVYNPVAALIWLGVLTLLLALPALLLGWVMQFIVGLGLEALWSKRSKANDV